MSVAIIIPSRLASTRLAKKALALIDDKPMVQWVFEQCIKAKTGDVYVATCCEEIASVIKSVGGTPIITDPNLPSGTDRVYAALQKINKKYEKVINVQGDMPFICPSSIRKVLEIFQPNSDITTLCAPINNIEDVRLLSIVKPVLSFIDEHIAKGIYFSRSPVPYNAKTYYHHLGIYGFLMHSLEKFVSSSKSLLEEAENLEQLRALELGMNIHVGIVKEAPIAVDTEDDLKQARYYAGRLKNTSY